MKKSIYFANIVIPVYVSTNCDTCPNDTFMSKYRYSNVVMKCYHQIMFTCCDKKRERNLKNPEHKEHYFYRFSSLCLLECLISLWLFRFYMNSYQLLQCVGDRPHNMQYLWTGYVFSSPDVHFIFIMYSIIHVIPVLC